MTHFKKTSKKLSNKTKKSKISKGGFPTNIDDESFSNEQKFIINFIDKLNEYNLSSVIELAYEQYDEKNALDVAETINKSSSGRSWMQSVFDSMWSCLRIFNLKHFFTDFLQIELYNLKKKTDQYNNESEKLKPLLTMPELLHNINVLIDKYGVLNQELLIVNCINLYLNNKPCLVHEGGKKIQNGGGWIMLIGIILFICAFPSALKQFANEQKTKKVDDAPKEDQHHGPGWFETYMDYQVAKKLTGNKDNVFDKGLDYFPSNIDYSKD